MVKKYNNKIIKSLSLYKSVSYVIKKKLINIKNKLSMGKYSWYNKNNDRKKLESLKKLIDARVKFFNIVVKEGALESINDVNHFTEIARLNRELDILVKKTKNYNIRHDNRFNNEINEQNIEFKKFKQIISQSNYFDFTETEEDIGHNKMIRILNKIYSYYKEVNKKLSNNVSVDDKLLFIKNLKVDHFFVDFNIVAKETMKNIQDKYGSSSNVINEKKLMMGKALSIGIRIRVLMNTFNNIKNTYKQIMAEKNMVNRNSVNPNILNVDSKKEKNSDHDSNSNDSDNEYIHKCDICESEFIYDFEKGYLPTCKCYDNKLNNDIDDTNSYIDSDTDSDTDIDTDNNTDKYKLLKKMEIEKKENIRIARIKREEKRNIRRKKELYEKKKRSKNRNTGINEYTSKYFKNIKYLIVFLTILFLTLYFQNRIIKNSIFLYSYYYCNMVISILISCVTSLFIILLSFYLVYSIFKIISSQFVLNIFQNFIWVISFLVISIINFRKFFKIITAECYLRDKIKKRIGFDIHHNKYLVDSLIDHYYNNNIDIEFCEKKIIIHCLSEYLISIQITYNNYLPNCEGKIEIYVYDNNSNLIAIKMCNLKN